MVARPSNRAYRAPVLGAAIAAVVLLLSSACSSPTTSNPAPATVGTIHAGRRTIATTTDVATSLVEAIADDDADVIPLTLRGQAAASWKPQQEAVDATRGADLLVAIGGGWEPWLADVRLPDTLELAPLLNPIPLGGSELSGSTAPSGAIDPRFWLDPDRTTQAARRIGDELVALGLDRAAVDQRVAALTAALAKADEAAQAALAPIPDDRRTLYAPAAHVGYLADRYGFSVTTARPAGTDAIEVVDATISGPGGTAPPATPATPRRAVLHLDALAPSGPPSDVPSLIAGNAAALAAAAS